LVLRYTPRFAEISGKAVNGQVAQLVEQRIENPRVGGSIPPLATNKIKGLRENVTPFVLPKRIPCRTFERKLPAVCGRSSKLLSLVSASNITR
jgi:hypothetical protein